MFKGLQGKKIIVTGACGSIGSVLVRYLDSFGAQVVMFDRDLQKINDLKNSLSCKNQLAVALDLTNSDEIKDAVKKILADEVKISGLVHCAGGGHVLPLRRLKKQYLLDDMQINYFAFIDLVREITAKGCFADEGGSIIALSSYASLDGEMCQTSYSAAKAALDGAVRALSYELVPKNIRINTIRPGMIDSKAVNDLKDASGDEAFAGTLAKQILGLGHPQDVANLCAFLLSDLGKFVTGRNIYWDGGRFR